MSSLVEICQVVQEKEILKCIFAISLLSPPIKRVGPSFEKIELNSPCPGMLCTKFGWNWPSGSGEEDENGKKFTDRRAMDNWRS